MLQQNVEHARVASGSLGNLLFPLHNSFLSYLSSFVSLFIIPIIPVIPVIPLWGCYDDEQAGHRPEKTP